MEIMINRIGKCLKINRFAWRRRRPGTNQVPRGQISRRVILALTGAMLVATVSVAQSPTCAEPRTLYVPIETVSTPLGIRGETRAQFLDRVYGKGKWTEGGAAGLAVVVREAEHLRVTLQEQQGVAPEWVDIVAEAQLEYLPNQGLMRKVTGHRQIGRYQLDRDARGDLTIPLSVMRESGAVLIITLAKRASPNGQVALVEAWQAPPEGCERRVLVPDRDTAIRLNHDSAAK